MEHDQTAATVSDHGRLVLLVASARAGAAARESGFEILLATRVQDLGDAIRDCGITLIPIRLRRANRNPLNELLSLWQLVAIYRREQPMIVHHVGVADADELSKPYTVRYHHGALYHVFGYGCRRCI
ncbi:MAG: hypothetical protein V3U60_08575 [Gammaproteobacteria bacterium]